MSGDTINPTSPGIHLGSHKDTILNFYFAFLVIGGHVGLPLLITTVILMNAIHRRHPTLVNVLVLWMVYATGCLLLLYSGEQKKSQPHFGICLTQASIIYGSFTGGSVATFCLVLELWMDFRCRGYSRNSLSAGISLLIAPWFFFLFFTMFSLVTGMNNPSMVTNKWVFYCTVSSDYIVYSVIAVGLVTITFLFIFQGLVLRYLFRSGKFRAVDQPSYRLWLRVSIFSFFSVIGFVIGNVVAFRPKEPAGYLGLSLLPLTIFLVFGTQKEYLYAWFRVRQKPGRNISSEPMAIKVQVLRTVESDNPNSAVKLSDTNKSLPLTPRSFDPAGHV